MAKRPPKTKVAVITLWDREVGAVAWDQARGLGTFEYTPEFVTSGLQISPLVMPLGPGTFSFQLNTKTYYGLPGLLADALPDKFGNKMIEIWLAQHGRSADDFSPVERLCYMGSRGMGALEFTPAIGPKARKSEHIEVSELVQLAEKILSQRAELAVNLKDYKEDALTSIIRVGSSAGGNRAKAVIAWNPKTEEVRSGQVPPPPGFEPWILKFDGVHDVSLGDPQHFGRIEYTYHRMAVEAGIEMTECRLLKEGERAHFMTRRFDRAEDGRKIHMQSLCAIAHYDFNASGEHSYEQAMGIIQQLNLGHPAMQEMFRRMAFNVIARNQDDHTRNIAFLMDEDGVWRLSPAYDMIWSYNTAPDKWTNRHQMRINGKQDGFAREDLLAVAEQYRIKGTPGMIKRVESAVSRWREFAQEAGVPPHLIEEIQATHRLPLV
jgi:serine/threonine-protein kinase HipA